MTRLLSPDIRTDKSFGPIVHHKEHPWEDAIKIVFAFITMSGVGYAAIQLLANLK